ncbi:hypothetical protein [Kribbella sp. CA-294648]|uniref:hypothetical protein n=1 Tax=Kribbella sp. CA-294648 TaxID=3239948 RepID=UPI003D9336AA
MRSEPGGLVDLTFTEQGWTARQIQGSRPDPAQWCAIGMFAGLLLGWLASLAGLDSLARVLLIVAGVLLAAGAILVGLDFLATLFGVGSMAATALSRGGRRQLRAQAKGITDDLMEITKGPEFVAADRVVAARVGPDIRGTAVELRLDDGSTRRYVRQRAGLVEPFQRLLGERLTHSA